MFPIKDDVPSHRPPLVNYLLIAANLAAFLYELSLGPGLQRFVVEFGIVPARVTAGEPGQWMTFLSSMFLHGGWGHFFGNMLYLWIFGDNVEDRLGHLPYLGFYLACGVVAGYAHVITNSLSPVPTIGASGAVAGVLGAYVIFQPKARILTLLPTFPMTTAYIPALFFLGVWFVLQLFSGVMQLGVTGAGGGVAFLAHVGGFLAGLVFGTVAAIATRRRRES